MKRNGNHRAGSMKTIEEVRTWFVSSGKTYKGWAGERGYNENIVGDLLRGKTIGRRGKSHNVAVLLGLKFGVLDAESMPDPKSVPHRGQRRRRP